MTALGVVVRFAPREIGPIITSIFEDGFGNLIDLVQPLLTPLTD